MITGAGIKKDAETRSLQHGPSVSGRSRTGLRQSTMTVRQTQQSMDTHRCSTTACAGSSTHAVDFRKFVLQAGDGIRVGFPAAVLAIEELLRAVP